LAYVNENYVTRLFSKLAFKLFCKTKRVRQALTHETNPAFIEASDTHSIKKSALTIYRKLRIDSYHDATDFVMPFFRLTNNLL